MEPTTSSSKGQRNETAYRLVLRMNEIQPDQWDEFDERDYTLIDAALRAAKVEGLREQQALLDEAYQVMSLWFKYFNSDIRPVDQWTEVVERVNAWLPLARDVRKARIADTEGQEGT